MSIDWSIGITTEKLIIFTLSLHHSFCFVIKMINQAFNMLDLITPIQFILNINLELSQ